MTFTSKFNWVRIAVCGTIFVIASSATVATASDVAKFPEAICAAAGTGDTALVSNRFPSKLLLARGYAPENLFPGSFADGGPEFLDALGETQMAAFFANSGVAASVQSSGIPLNQIACFSFASVADADRFAMNAREGARSKRLIEIKIAG